MNGIWSLFRRNSIIHWLIFKTKEKKERDIDFFCIHINTGREHQCATIQLDFQLPERFQVFELFVI